MAGISKKNLIRIKKSKMNASVTLITSIIMGVCSFLERTFFNQLFSEEYLGLYSFNFNIISSLNSIELGLSVAIAYALYAPLEYDNKPQIAAIMSFMKKAYFIMGSVIISAGLILLPFFGLLVNTSIDINLVRLYFMIFLLGNVSSYFLAYKNVLINANQEQYKVTLVTNLSWSALYLTQILIITKTQNFLFYSIALFFFNILRNVILNIIARNNFNLKQYKGVEKIDKNTLKDIKRNTVGLISNKMGQFIVNSTDSLLISMLVSTAVLGKYSNYQMFYSGLFAISGIIPAAITASIGNANVTEDRDSMLKSFYTINLGSYFIYSIVTVVFIVVSEPIIKAFFGPDRALPLFTVILYCFNFYLSNMREVLLTYKSSLGLYWYDRKRPIAEALINLIASIILGKIFGINGIIFGTTISRLFVNFILEPRTVFHIGFSHSTRKYYLSSLVRFLIVAIMTSLSLFLIRLFNFSSITSIVHIASLSISLGALLQIIVNLLVSLIVSMIILFICYAKNPEMKTILATLKIMISRKKFI